MASNIELSIKYRTADLMFRAVSYVFAHTISLVTRAKKEKLAHDTKKPDWIQTKNVVNKSEFQ